MFKTKEELTKKITPESDWDCDKNYNLGVELAFDFFAERVEFYKKYAEDKPQLAINYPKLYEEFKEQMEMNDLQIIGLPYVDWLFDFCFGDVK